MTERFRVIILGAGPAGLGAAYQLARQKNADVTVLERNWGVGGMAGSFGLAGLNVDYGSHRLHSACAPKIIGDIQCLLGDDLLLRPRHGRIRLQGRWLHFPLKPLDLVCSLPPRFAISAAYDAVKRILPRRADRSETSSFESIMLDGLGPTICRNFYFPYVQKIWGMEPDAISPVLARRRVQGSSPLKLLRKVLGSVPGFRSGGKGEFFYPRQGYGQLSQKYFNAAAEQGAKFRFDATVTSVHVGSDGVESVQFETGGDRETLAADHVWSTIPLQSLVDAVSPAAPAEVSEASRSIRFRAMILIYLVVQQQRFSEFDAHYFPDTQTAISRLSEPRNYSGVTEPQNVTVLCAELPCTTDGEFWSMSDAQLGEVVTGDLARNGIPISAPVTQVVTRRLSHAYPIYDMGFEQHFERIDQWLTEIPRLLTFGRQGLFAHDNTHHALEMAYAAADCLNDGGDFDQSRWNRYRRQFESHVVED
jgi:protoporphyrinogen oxidase